jgi:hypothetical protein
MGGLGQAKQGFAGAVGCWVRQSSEGWVGGKQGWWQCLRGDVVNTLVLRAELQAGGNAQEKILASGPALDRVLVSVAGSVW